MHFQFCRYRSWAKAWLAPLLTLGVPLPEFNFSLCSPTLPTLSLLQRGASPSTSLEGARHPSVSYMQRQHAWSSHIAHLSPQWWILSRPFSLDPSIVFRASLMAPVALCLWCYHLIHAGCLPVQHCLPCKQKLGAGPTGISVIFVSSPYPAHAGVYWMTPQANIREYKWSFQTLFCLINQLLFIESLVFNFLKIFIGV